GYFGGLLLGQVGDIYETSIMSLTPIALFYLGALLIVFYVVSSGIEVLARFSELIFPVIVIMLVLNLALSIPRIEQGELMPIFDDGIKPLLYGVLKIPPFAMEYILFLAGIVTFLPTHNQELGQLRTGVWRAVFLVGIVDALVVLMQILIFGPTETVRIVYGLLELGKMVEVSRTVAGIESLFLGVWLGAAVIKISAFFFMTTWGLESVFTLKGLKWRVVISAVFFGIALGFVRGPSLIGEISAVDDYLILPFASIWIPTLWGVSRWKKGGVLK
ncbi:MAG: GerAB/ArcD/ProY family transporter, partial [Bacillota bacterium]|nr:GerAB/ArcD/ProY family transporter [Bacillota bacterium]